MYKIIEIAEQLLQLTHSLLEEANSMELTEIESTQRQRAALVRELNTELLNSYPEEVLLESRRLIEISRGLEEKAIDSLQQKQNEIRTEHRRLATSHKAIKAYGKAR